MARRRNTSVANGLRMRLRGAVVRRKARMRFRLENSTMLASCMIQRIDGCSSRSGCGCRFASSMPLPILPFCEVDRAQNKRESLVLRQQWEQ